MYYPQESDGRGCRNPTRPVRRLLWKVAWGRFLQRRAAAITTGLPESFQLTFWRMLCWTGHENHALKYVTKGHTEKTSSLLAYLRSSGLLLTGANSCAASGLPLAADSSLHHQLLLFLHHFSSSPQFYS